MIKVNKNTIKEIVIIAIASALLAIVYNSIRTDSLPFFPKSQAERMVADTVLFSQPDGPTAAILDTNATAPVVDSSKIERADSAITSGDGKELAPTRADTAANIDFDAILATAKRSSFGEYKVVDYQQMRRIVADKSGQFLIIDARRPEPYSQRHIGNAINICPYDSADVVMNKVAALPFGKTIIVYCDGGNCDSSHEIANILQAMGFDKFYIYEGGWEEWGKK